MGSRFRWVWIVALLVAAVGCDNGRSRSSRGGQGQPGDLALDYVTAANFPRLKVEVDYMEGVGPSVDAIARVRDLWERRLDKPGGVDIVIDSEIPRSQAKSRWEIGDILALESAWRANFTDDRNNRGVAVIWMVYLNGRSEFDEDLSRALGVAYDGSSVAIFRDNIGEASPASVVNIVEALVLIHEGGHLFGLVNNGIPMVNDHEDPDHARHDVLRTCAMFHRIETSNVPMLLENPPLDYDFQCQLDMFSAGGPPPEALPPADAPSIEPRAPSPLGPSGIMPDLAVIPATN